jgi:hypothetical protein
MTNQHHDTLEIRGMSEAAVRRSYGDAQRRVAYGHRYSADGWSAFGALYAAYAPRFGRVDVDERAVERYVTSLRVRGPNGAAMHGCEDVKDVR